MKSSPISAACEARPPGGASLPKATGMIALSQSEGIATLTLNRPARRNAITLAMWRDLPRLIDEVARAPSVAVVVLTGAGGHFASGADLDEIAAVYATASGAASMAQLMADAMGALAACPKPVIAQIEGACIGGGCGLALACDIRLAASTARLGITPGKLGLAYSLADTKRLSDAVGLSRARMLLYTGRIVTAEQAATFGLVDEVTDAPALPGLVTALAQEIASASQVSVRIAKATLARIAAGVTADTDETRAWFQQAMTGQDFAEGRRAFLEKRKPRFG